jgi:hypothetical protein
MRRNRRRQYHLAAEAGAEAFFATGLVLLTGLTAAFLAFLALTTLALAGADATAAGADAAGAGVAAIAADMPRAAIMERISFILFP